MNGGSASTQSNPAISPIPSTVKAASRSRTAKPLGPVSGIVLLFLYIYNLSFSAIPAATTGRVALLLISLIYFREIAGSVVRIFTNHQWFFAMMAVITAYSIAIEISGNVGEWTQVSRLANFQLFSLYGCLAFTEALDGDHEKLMKYFAVATLVQSGFVIFSLFSPSYRMSVTELLVQGGNNPLSFVGRPPGLSNTVGASFSIIQALGFLASMLSIKKSGSIPETFVYALTMLLCLVSTVLTGRTGLILCILMLLYFIASSSNAVRGRLFLGICIVPIIITAAWPILYDKVISEDPILSNSFRYIADTSFELFLNSGKVKSVSHLYSMQIPPLSIETILGTGTVRPDFGDGHDAGYVQTYSALGLVMALAFYLSYLAFLVKNMPRGGIERRIGIILVAIMFLIESKEPFIFKYILPFFILTSFLMTERIRIKGLRYAAK